MTTYKIGCRYAKLYATEVVVSAGLALLSKGRILLLKPTNSGPCMWTVPKGQWDTTDESLLHTACRETFEECGIAINPESVNESEYVLIKYKNRKGEIYKEIFCFVYKLEESWDDTQKLHKNMLQPKEVEDSCFFDMGSARDNIFYKQVGIIDYLENKTTSHTV